MTLRRGGAEYPAFQIDKQTYNNCWFESLSSFLMTHLQKKLPFSQETLSTYFSRKAPSLLYDSFLEDYEKSEGKPRDPIQPLDPLSRARMARENIFENLFKRLEQKRLSQPEFLQSIWKEAVGHSLAIYSQLLSIDEEKQTAFFRCVSSVISYEIRNDSQIAAKISSLTGKPIRYLKQVYY
ncbi:hypothetical protein IT6_01130 [Methylacidiphilum caldifontis]|uniref:Uncharacterized protein n=2 Tax=Methylacidiphilum caldifontis TaxID=2795386 RepID=A0A4Y8P7F7_9BACT|nr:hypothetical protein [Methylacidiphilum caldifontis]QSR88940.1 hypothetical protein IT6_01130 [Methylacidiphilum caldifontis]TFE66159.1 hypothetical protein A7Q10_02130 [Methylacidiphilum caldifontis]